ncbi:carbohydrate ABC transporter permease [Paenibacillus humicola]|uniref:carbohydrate ABC transporter permease n=1 Tax=Paenibacillus humicola TaxID=3110540 RepID=UPI00237C084E|nr:sugar ABC transporter permease [Paenibacillus humicola]
MHTDPNQLTAGIHPAAKRRKIGSILIPYVFILPFFIIFAVFILYPMIYSLVLSFSEFKSGATTFVGFANYKQLFTTDLFWKSLLNTGEVLVVQVPIMLISATIIASLIHSNRLRFRALFRLFFFLPVLIDLVTYSIVFSLLFSETNGLINFVLHAVGIGDIPWRSNPWAAKALIIIAITWRWTGYNSIILLSGLQSVSREYYEAANIDGAGPIRSFFSITLPMLKPVLLFCMILSTIGSLQLFTEPFILTSGGPDNSTITVIQYLYQTAFTSFNFGLASAGAYILTFIIAALSYIQIRVTKGGEY